jgi:hypothetical protein
MSSTSNRALSRGLLAIATALLVLLTSGSSLAQTEGDTEQPSEATGEQPSGASGDQATGKAYKTYEEGLRLDRAIDVMAVDVVKGEPQRFEGRAMEMVSIVCLLALAGTLERENAVRELAANVGETSRTDRQVGGGSTAAASTRLTEKAGINAILGLAIENGAIQQESRGTELTLSTTPYAFIAWAAGGDTQQNYERFDVWRRFGFGFAFNLSDNESLTVGGFDTKNFSRLDFRARILGDRSTRSKGFMELWAREVQPQIQDLLDQQVSIQTDIFDDTETRLEALVVAADSVIYKRMMSEYRAYDLNNPEATKEQKEEFVRESLRTILIEEVYEPVRSRELLTNEDKRTRLKEKAYPELVDALENETKSVSRIKELVKEYNQKQSLLTFDYALHRIQDASDFSELKIVYEVFVNPLDIALNGLVSLNHDPSSPDLNQQIVRQYGATLALEGNIKNVFAGLFGDPNLRPITITASGQVSRLQDVRDMLYAAQIQINLPIFSGFSIPIAMNYASRTETNANDEFTVTLGGGIEFDSILAAVRTGDLTGLLQSR